MVEDVENFSCFHVTRALPYNPHPPLKAGCRLSSGTCLNPFFSFYEKPRMYGVNQPDGSSIQFGAIQFLKQVRDGQINAPSLPAIAVEVAEHYAMLAREVIMEVVRLEVAPLAPSRQTALWVTESIGTARFWADRLGHQGRIVELSASGRLLRADAGLLLADSEPLSRTRQKAVSYWTAFDPQRATEPEILFAGTAAVIRDII